ncbi:MAG: K+dependent Na+ exchanger related-protein [Parcubacteria group bacterium GW2011_GWB1_53_43]|nr:MAG: K+dependent Na+ exchanger related-protein [Parcubacteria group bacterium GW2011_GWB1_53_43]
MPSQLFLLFVLFFLLAKAADIIIVGIREISEKLKVNLYVAGIMLGFFTSLPEMSIAWSALASRAVSVSSGNLYGGIIVLFGFILGLSLVANRNVRTDGRWRSILPITLYLALPVLLALDGVLGAIDSGILILGYFAVPLQGSWESFLQHN